MQALRGAVFEHEGFELSGFLQVGGAGGDD
jgi:hypothetical protein